MPKYINICIKSAVYNNYYILCSGENEFNSFQSNGYTSFRLILINHDLSKECALNSIGSLQLHRLITEHRVSKTNNGNTFRYNNNLPRML